MVNQESNHVFGINNLVSSNWWIRFVLVFDKRSLSIRPHNYKTPRQTVEQSRFGLAPQILELISNFKLSNFFISCVVANLVKSTYKPSHAPVTIDHLKKSRYTETVPWYETSIFQCGASKQQNNRERRCSFKHLPGPAMKSH